MSADDLFDPYDNLIQLHKARLAGFQQYAEELLDDHTPKNSSYLFSWRWDDVSERKPRRKSLPRTRLARPFPQRPQPISTPQNFVQCDDNEKQAHPYSAGQPQTSNAAAAETPSTAASQIACDFNPYLATVAWHTARLDPICRALEECTRDSRASHTSRASLHSFERSNDRMRLALAMRGTTMQNRVAAAMAAALQGQAKSSSTSTKESGCSNASEHRHSDFGGASRSHANQQDVSDQDDKDTSHHCDSAVNDYVDDDDVCCDLDPATPSPSPPHILSRIQSLILPTQKSRRARRQKSHRRDALLNSMTRAAESLHKRNVESNDDHCQRKDEA